MNKADQSLVAEAEAKARLVQSEAVAKAQAEIFVRKAQSEQSKIKQDEVSMRRNEIIAKAAGKADVSEEDLLGAEFANQLKDSGGSFVLVMKGLMADEATKKMASELIAKAQVVRIVSFNQLPSMTAEVWAALVSTLRNTQKGIPSNVVRNAFPRLSVMAASQNGFKFSDGSDSFNFYPGQEMVQRVRMAELEEMKDGQKPKWEGEIMNAWLAITFIESKVRSYTAAAINKWDPTEKKQRRPQLFQQRMQVVKRQSEAVRSLAGMKQWKGAFVEFLVDTVTPPVVELMKAQSTATLQAALGGEKGKKLNGQ